MDRICDYTLYALVGMDDMQRLDDDNNAPLQSGGNVIYTLTANQYFYFPFFEVTTNAGPMSISLATFSKIGYFSLSVTVVDITNLKSWSCICYSNI